MILHRCRWSLTLWVAATAAIFAGCGDDDPDEPAKCSPETVAATALAARSRPAGIAEGEPYRWLARSWTSPLGLTFRTYGLAVDGIPIHGRRQIEVYDGSGELVHRAGTGDAVLAALRGPLHGAIAAAEPRRFHHPMAASQITRSAQPHPLMREEARPLWYYRGDGELVAAVASERVNLVGEKPRGEVTVRDMASGVELARHRTIFDLADPEYLVYANADGRPLNSPLGDIYPHPTGVPDGQVPAFVNQRAIPKSAVQRALPDDWIDPADDETRGNNVVVFFNSLIGKDGKLADLYDEQDKETPEYGPLPDDIGNDFFAVASDGRFSFPYDTAGTATRSEYFQLGAPGDEQAPPDPRDVALNAKIVQAFYNTNWLHDFFYAAGFDELGGNAQQSNYGRGGLSCDPLIVHSGFLGTFTYSTADGTSPVLALGLNPRSNTWRDSSMDFTITGHEWGHYMISRLAGTTIATDGLGNLQGQSMHEGIADFIGVLATVDAGDDLNGAFSVGAYTNLDYIERRPTLPPAEAPADIYYGIRRFPYSLDLAKNPLTLRNLAEPPAMKYYNWKGRGPALAEVHTAGEVFSAALFQCFGNIVAANASVPFEELRLRMAKYLVAGLAAFPEHPSFLEARDAFLTVTKAVNATDYAACRAGFATRGMGKGARGPDGEFAVEDEFVDTYNAADIQESFVDAD